MSVTLPRLSQLVDLGQGQPSAQFMTLWDQLCGTIESNLDAIATTDTSLALQIIQLQGVINGTTPTVPDVTKPYEWTAQQTYDLAPIAPGYKVGLVTPIQVVGAQQPAIANLAGAATLPQAVTAINTILAMLRVHGLIAP